MNPLTQLLISQGPALIQFASELFRKQNPNAPQPSSVEVIAAFDQLFASSLARDQFLIAALEAEIAARKSPVA